MCEVKEVKSGDGGLLCGYKPVLATRGTGIGIGTNRFQKDAKDISEFEKANIVKVLPKPKKEKDLVTFVTSIDLN